MLVGITHYEPDEIPIVSYERQVYFSGKKIKMKTVACFASSRVIRCTLIHCIRAIHVEFCYIINFLFFLSLLFLLHV